MKTKNNTFFQSILLAEEKQNELNVCKNLANRVGIVASALYENKLTSEYASFRQKITEIVQDYCHKVEDNALRASSED